MAIQTFAKTALQKERIDVEQAKAIFNKIKKGRTITDAAKELKISRNTAYTRLRNPAFLSVMSKALSAAGVSNLKIAKTIKSAMEANKPVVIDKEIHDYPDHAIRLKASETAARLKGHYEGLEDAQQAQANNISININFVQPDEAAANANTITINPGEGNNNE